MANAKSAYGRGTGKSHPVDVHVGARVRLRRTLHGMTQTDLGDAIGLTFQQVQKYERGTNRISSSRLYELAQVLDVPIENFFEDIPPVALASSPAKRHGKAKEPARHELDPFAKRETLSLVRSYYEIKDANVRQRVYELIKAAGAADV
jgi:transcriptional regulator with XRE-family HTH domain